MLSLLTSLAFLSFCCLSAAIAQAQPNNPSIISPAANVTLIKSGFTNLEGSSVAPDGRIFFVELFYTGIDPLAAGKIWSYNPDSGEFAIFASPSGRTSGTEFDMFGNMICTEFTDDGGRRITKHDIKTRFARFLATGHHGNRSTDQTT